MVPKWSQEGIPLIVCVCVYCCTLLNAASTNSCVTFWTSYQFFSRLPLISAHHSRSPHFRPLTLLLTCTASMVCPLPETQAQLSMVTRSVCRQKPDHQKDTRTYPPKNSFLLLHDRGSKTAELKVKCLFIYFSCKHHCSFLLHPFLQFYRSLSQYSQELYRRVGSFPAHLFHRYTSHSPSTCTSPHQHVQLHLSLLISRAKYFS